MAWTYTRLPEVEQELDAYVKRLLSPSCRPKNDEEVKAFKYIEQACQELKAKLQRYTGYGPDPRDELKDASRIGIRTADTFYLHHKGLYVLFYRDLLNHTAIATGFVFVEWKIRSLIASFFGRRD